MTTHRGGYRIDGGADRRSSLEAETLSYRTHMTIRRSAMKRSKPTAPRLPFAAVLAALLFGSATAAFADGLDSLDESRRRWQAANLDSYVYAYTKFCECHPETPPETYVTVRRGEIVDVRHKPYGFDHYVQAEPRNFEWYWTIEQLFDLVASGIERGADVRVRYDDELGYPVRLFVDRDRDLIGDEIDLELTRLDPVER